MRNGGGGARKTLTKTNFIPTVRQLHNYILELEREKMPIQDTQGPIVFN